MVQTAVLLIDDDPALLQALPETLRLHLPNIMVETCVSGDVALERLRQRTYATVVSDLIMPGMDGVALLRNIKGLHLTTPVVLMTAVGNRRVIADALEAGAFDFIPKPFDREEFIKSIRRSLRIYRLRQSLTGREVRLAATSRRLRQLTESHRAMVASKSDPERNLSSQSLVENSHQHIERGTARSLSSLERIRRQLEREELTLQRGRSLVVNLETKARQRAGLRVQAFLSAPARR
jgi:two-component system, sensor histidine kinase and response regulator